jgi:putative membrane protein
MIEARLKGKYTIIILGVSIIIPLVVAILLFMPEKADLSARFTKFLPHFNGFLNTLTSGILLIGFLFIKNGQVIRHKRMMSTAFVLGIVFLVSYIIYHATNPSTIYGDSNGNGVLELEEAAGIGSWRYVYLAILASHILLAIIVVPFVLFSFYYALTTRFDMHKKIVRYTLPVWLYVSVTGVVVYLMISPYYN